MSDGRILALGGHDFDRKPGNQALCDRIVELAGSDRARICLLPTASGDPTDQIARFRRCFGERGCEPSEIALFRLGERPIDLREHLLGQDAIYVGGGSLVNLLAIWQAHGIDEILSEAAREGILLCGQSAGAMCWFESGITSSSGQPQSAEGLGVLAGTASVHYHSEPERRLAFIDAIADGAPAPGFGLDDQAGVMFENGALAGAIAARAGAGVWRVSESGEEQLDAEQLSDAQPPIGSVPDEVAELRRTLEARAVARRGRLGSGPGRL